MAFGQVFSDCLQVWLNKNQTIKPEDGQGKPDWNLPQFLRIGTYRRMWYCVQSSVCIHLSLGLRWIQILLNPNPREMFGKNLDESESCQLQCCISSVCGLCGAMVGYVAFRVQGRGFKSTHGCSHTVQKSLICPRIFGQCTLNISLPFTITSQVNLCCKCNSQKQQAATGK